MTEDTTAAPQGVGTMDAVVFDVPDVEASVAFWRELTGAADGEADDGWRSLTTSDGWSLAFQHAPGLVRAEWPGQEHPQQLHVDLRVPDVAAATERAVALGATLLRESESWNTLADPAGHPFDLCFAENNPGTTVMGVTIDCPDASSLARFWSRVVGEEVTYDADGVAMLGGDRPLLFQTVEDYTRPRWPDPERPQQLHVDIRVDDLDAAEAAVRALGAERLPNPDRWRVFADPAGHPFCLVG